MLGPLGGAIDHQDGGGRREDVEDADERLLSHAAGQAPARGQQQGADRGESEPIGVAGGTLNRMPGNHADGGAQRRHLCQRQIGKHDVAPQNLETEPGMDPGEDNGRRERQRRECENVLQHDRSVRYGR